MFFEKRDLPFPRRDAGGKTAYEQDGEAIAMDFIMQIDVPDIAKRHPDHL
jgi:hypothetical protein